MVGQGAVDAGWGVGKILLTIGLQCNLTGGKIVLRIFPCVKVQRKIKGVVVNLNGLQNKLVNDSMIYAGVGQVEPAFQRLTDS